MKFKIPFLKKADDIDEVGPDNGLDTELSQSGPSALRKRLPWVAVIGAYVSVGAGVAGILTYLILNAGAIEEEMRADRPYFNTDQLMVEDVAMTPDMASETTDTQAADAAGESHEADDTPVEETAPTGENEAAIQEAAFGEENADGPIEPDTFGSMLQTHPDAALIEETPVGPLPKIGEDGRKAWQVYSRPVNVLEQRPKIAIVVINLGISDKQTEAALTLPGSMSLAFAPYSQRLDSWITQSRQAGHEVLVTLPMEPIDFPKSDPGPFALLSTLDEEQNIRRLEWILTRSTGYVGLVNFMGSRFANNEKMMQPIFTALKDRGLAYLGTQENVLNTISKIADKSGVPHVSADLLIDEDLSRSSIVASLARVELLAKTNGVAVAIARPYPVSLDRLKAWSRDLLAKGFVLVPISSVIATKTNAS